MGQALLPADNNFLETDMSRSKFPVWQTVLVIAIFSFCNCETNFAQSINGFSKSSRGYGPSAAARPGGGQRSSSYGGSGQSRSGRGNGNSSRSYQSQGRSNGSRSYSSNNSRNRSSSQRYNHHSFYPSRSVIGTGHRYSPGHFYGSYVPLRSYGYVNSFGFNGIPVDPYGYGYNNRGFNPGYGNYNPAYATYGSYLNNNGGVLNSNVIGSSVAAQALERSRNQQSVIPVDPALNADRDAEILRLQIELERAKQALANQQQPQLQQTQTLKPPVQNDPTQSNQEAIDQLGLAPIIETNQLAAASHLKAERAFRAGDYGQAARFSGLSKSLDESNGKLLLFASQAHFANGEYREAVDALTKANSLLPTEEMGWVVENFKLFYGQNDFVSQIKQLSTHLQQSPTDSGAYLLRGYQYGALGYPDAAKKDLQRAKELGANIEFVEASMKRFAR